MRTFILRSIQVILTLTIGISVALLFKHKFAIFLPVLVGSILWVMLIFGIDEYIYFNRQ